jgi:hypothetical protein
MYMLPKWVSYCFHEHNAFTNNMDWLYSILTYPLNTLLEKTGYLALSNCVNQFSRCMMWWYKLNTVDEAVKFLQHKEYTLHNKYY